jgi:hypothetical protein
MKGSPSRAARRQAAREQARKDGKRRDANALVIAQRLGNRKTGKVVSE